MLRPSGLVIRPIVCIPNDEYDLPTSVSSQIRGGKNAINSQRKIVKRHRLSKAP